jgi:hypothetical protein
MSKYNYITKKSLEQEILIMIRNKHVSRISSKLIEQNIISNQYIDNLIKLDNMKNNTKISTFTNELRIQYLNKLLLKECIKGTAKIIADIDNY